VSKATIAIGLIQGLSPLYELGLEREHFSSFSDGYDISPSTLIEELRANLSYFPWCGVRPERMNHLVNENLLRRICVIQDRLAQG
jgi:hypothetical protein